MSAPYRGRFAPSPSGPLHAGSIAAALASWLDARAHGGQWCLRFEDVDSERCDPAHIPLIRSQLAGLGLEWDLELPSQGQRLNHYAELLQLWLADGLAYACACTRRDLAPYRGDGETCYPGLCRDRGLAPQGQAIRFRLPPITEVRFVDGALGPQKHLVAEQCGDVVLRRRNGDYSYQFAVSVDDAEQGITHVVRGLDLLPSTGRQRLLLDALGAAAPVYLHHPLVTDPQGRKLSKSTGAAPAGLDGALGALQRAGQSLGLDLPPDPPSSVPDWLHLAVHRWNLCYGPGSGKLRF